MKKLLEIINVDQHKEIIVETSNFGYRSEWLYTWLANNRIVKVNDVYLTLHEALGLPLEIEWVDEISRWNRGDYVSKLWQAASLNSLEEVEVVLPLVNKSVMPE